MKHALVFLSLILIASVPLSAWSYMESSVTNGGTITGQVILDGNKPPALAYSLITNPDTEFCGRISTGTGWRILDEFQVAPDGGLKILWSFSMGLRKANRSRRRSPLGSR